MCFHNTDFSLVYSTHGSFLHFRAKCDFSSFPYNTACFGWSFTSSSVTKTSIYRELFCHLKKQERSDQWPLVLGRRDDRGDTDGTGRSPCHQLLVAVYVDTGSGSLSELISCLPASFLLPFFLHSSPLSSPPLSFNFLRLPKWILPGKPTNLFTDLFLN